MIDWQCGWYLRGWEPPTLSPECIYTITLGIKKIKTEITIEIKNILKQNKERFELQNYLKLFLYKKKNVSKIIRLQG